MSGTDIVPVEDLGERFPVVGNPDALEALTENLGGDAEEITVFDLDRIKIPSGGGRAWEIPTLDGIEAKPEITGVIVGVIARRSFWESSLDESTGDPSPPDCTSEDNVHGKGVYGVGSTLHPSGKCADCPMNQFQEIKGRHVKPCSEQRLVVFVPEGAILPVVIQLPPTSMKALRHYMMRLASSSVVYYKAITTLALKRVDGNPAYSIVEPKLHGRIADADAAKALKDIGDNIVEAYKNQTTARTAAADDDA